MIGELMGGCLFGLILGALEGGGSGSFLQLLATPEVSWWFAGAIVVGAAVVWWRFSVLELGKALRQLRQGLRLVGDAGKGEVFEGALARLDEQLRHNPLLARAWGDYTDQLLRAPREGLGVRSSRDAGYFFNDRLLLQRGIDLRLYHAIPSYLVGIGLVLTFVGLVAALFMGSMALNRDPATILEALQGLLMAASFKFITSIAGLGSSLGFSYLLKVRLHVWQRELEVLCHELNRAAPVISAENLLFETLTELRELRQPLRQLPQDLAVAMDRSLRDNLSRLVDPLAEQVGKVTERLSFISQEAVARMVTDFREQLAGAAREQMGTLVEELKSARVALDGVAATVGISGRQFGEEVEKATSQVVRRLSGAGEEFAAGVQPLNEQVAALQKTFASVDARFASQLDLFTASVEVMRKGLEEFRQTTQVLQGVSTPIHQATQELDAVARRIHESNRASMHALEQLARFSQTLNETAQQTRETWDVYRQRFEKVDDDLKGVVEQLGLGFRRYQEIVENFMRQLDQSLAQSTQVLSASVQELAETMEEIEAARRAELKGAGSSRQEG